MSYHINTIKVYTPLNNIEGRVHRTKADADADTAVEVIGETKPLVKYFNHC